MTKAMPDADLALATDSKGLAAVSEPVMLVTMSVIVLVVLTGSPTRPIRDTSAISAGNSASRP